MIPIELFKEQCAEESRGSKVCQLYIIICKCKTLPMIQNAALCLIFNHPKGQVTPIDMHTYTVMPPKQ